MVLAASVAKTQHWLRLLDFFVFDPLPRAAEFYLGAVGAQWVKAGFKANSPTVGLLLMVAPLAIYCSITPENARCPALMNLIFMPGAFLLILAIARFDVDGAKSWMQGNFFVALGNSSFALYMTHAILLRAFEIVLITLLPYDIFESKILEILALASFVLIAIFLSIVVHNGFELPARKKLLRLITGKSIHTSGPSSGQNKTPLLRE